MFLTVICMGFHLMTREIIDKNYVGRDSRIVCLVVKEEKV